MCFVLAEPSILNGDKANAYVLSWKSTMIKRMCRSTMAAETQSQLAGVAQGMKLRSVLTDMMGGMTPFSWWETSKSTIRHLWLTDCESLHSYLVNPVAAGNEDARLELDLEDLRQILWEDVKGNPIDQLKETDYDVVRWIDTSTMLADPLTKNMKPNRLLEFLDTGVLDLEPTPESVVAKMMKQKQRQAAKQGKSEDAET